MAEIIAFGASPDLDVMDRQALTAYLAEIRRRIAALDEREPENMSSEAYDEWSEEPTSSLRTSRTIFSTG